MLNAMPTRHVPRMRIAVVLALAVVALAACGKSERQKLEEKAAADAQWDAAVAAADAERQKQEQELLKQEMGRIADADAEAQKNAPSPALPVTSVMSADEAIRRRELPQVRQQVLAVLRNMTPHPQTTNIRFDTVNAKLNGICGEIDFEYTNESNNKKSRSGNRKFIISWDDSAASARYGIDFDYRDWRSSFNSLYASADCTPETH
jgi:hypothetical protein